MIKTEKHIRPQAEAARQTHGVVGGDFPFATQDHRPSDSHLPQ